MIDPSAPQSWITFHTSIWDTLYYGNQPAFSSNDFLKELELYGIRESEHYKIGGYDTISWNENYNVNWVQFSNVSKYEDLTQDDPYPF